MTFRLESAAPAAEDTSDPVPDLPSIARAAEDFVRAGARGNILWHGASLDTGFQPLVCARRGECVGYEALVRAESESGTAIAPAQLFDMTEPGGARALLDWSCRALHLRNYARLDPGNRTLHLNVHPDAAAHDATDPGELGGLIRYYGLVPKRVCVEIGAAAAPEPLLRAAVASYRELGVAVALDEFGSGASNLDRAVALRPDIVKIDRKLLAGSALGRTRSRRLLAQTIDMLHELNARVVVEGIETVAEAQAALDAQADYLQGVHFCAPGPGLAGEKAARARFAELTGARDGRRPLFA